MANLMETMELVDVKHRVRITANAHSVIYMNNKFISNYENTNSIDLLSYIRNYTHEGRKTQCPLSCHMNLSSLWRLPFYIKISVWINELHNRKVLRERHRRPLEIHLLKDVLWCFSFQLIRRCTWTVMVVCFLYRSSKLSALAQEGTPLEVFSHHASLHISICYSAKEGECELSILNSG